MVDAVECILKIDKKDEDILSLVSVGQVVGSTKQLYKVHRRRAFRPESELIEVNLLLLHCFIHSECLLVWRRDASQNLLEHNILPGL